MLILHQINLEGNCAYKIVTFLRRDLFHSGHIRSLNKRVCYFSKPNIKAICCNIASGDFFLIFFPLEWLERKLKYSGAVESMVLNEMEVSFYLFTAS